MKIMKKSSLLFLMLLGVTHSVLAQIETANQATTLDAKWTEVPKASAQSDGDLHLSGQSMVTYTIKNKTMTQRDYYSYFTTVEIRSKNGEVKKKKYYKVAADSGNTTWEESIDGNSYSFLGYGNTVSSSLSIPNGETGDYLYMTVKNIVRGNGVEVILTRLASTTTRYDLYDTLPLFGSDTWSPPFSNRIKDHINIIDVYVHRTILGHGAWSTLCLPFNLTDAQIKKSLGSNVVYSEFGNVDLKKGHINFYSTSSGMKAGKPYLLQNNGETIENFFADDVTFTVASVRTANENRKSTNVSNGYCFVGLLEPTQVNIKEYKYNPNGRAVYIAGSNKNMQELKRLSYNGTIKAFRCYMVFPAEAAGAKSAADMMIDIDEALNATTSITSIQVDGQKVNNDDIYNLNGQHVGNDISNLPKGIYIRNGKKFIVR